MTSIYLLWFEDDGLPLYVGWTSRPVEVRGNEHSKWIKSEFGKVPQIELLETIPGNDATKAWKSAERKWILFFRTLSGKLDINALLNVNSGGSSFSIESAILGGKNKAGKSTSQKGKKWDHVSPLKGRKNPKLSESLTGKRLTESHKRNTGEGIKVANDQKRFLREKFLIDRKQAENLRKLIISSSRTQDILYESIIADYQEFCSVLGAQSV